MISFQDLPGRFAELTETDFPKCDLLIVLGTSLVVQPFAGLVTRCEADDSNSLLSRGHVIARDHILI